MNSSLFDLSGKKAIITGASGSIGLACAQALADFNAEVTLVGRNLKKLELARKQIHSSHPVRIFPLNLTCVEELRNFFLQQVDQDILLNSVGTNRPQSLLQVTEEVYDQIMEINLKSAFFQTRYLVEARKSIKKPLSIIHISSQMGYVGGLDRSVYCASKHALEGFCKSASIEIGVWNMRINTISPTFILSNMTQSTLTDPAKKAQIINRIAFNKLGETCDIKGAAVYLASDASSLVTGTTIKVDGGWTAS